MSEQNRLITVDNLSVSFMTAVGEIKAVRNVNFHLDKGETLAIVGESGCGKSVTVQTIMRLNAEPPAIIRSGSIKYAHNDTIVDITTLNDKQMQRFRGEEFSMIFQDAMTSLNPTAKVGKQICEGIRRHSKVSFAQAKKQTLALFEHVGLPNPEAVFERYPHTMSGGQRQRVMIAMALSCKPSVLLADEPTTALDVTVQAQILNLMNKIKKEDDMSIIFITHNLGVVAKMADKVAVMYAGQIIEYGTLNDIFYAPKHPYTWGLLSSMPDLKMNTNVSLTSIPGTPPDLFAPPKGCGFSARCDYCMQVCLDSDPKSYTVNGEHTVRCWLVDKRCPKEIVPPVGRDKTVFKTTREDGESC